MVKRTKVCVRIIELEHIIFVFFFESMVTLTFSTYVAQIISLLHPDLLIGNHKTELDVANRWVMWKSNRSV